MITARNPNPKPGTNNNYTQDGYGSATAANTGGSYSQCADPSQPGVGAIDSYLAALPYKAFQNCQPGRYYLLNNYNPGYNVDGTVNTAPYTVPPQKTDYNTIGNELSDHGISWGYFGEGYDNGQVSSGYCGICDPMQYSTSIMTNPALRKNTQHGLGDFISEAAAGTLPAVSFLKPADDDGHPAYSTLSAFESFVAHAVSAVQGNAKLWRSTAILVTFDEGGGYYDSGYVQPVSFFGDGTRVPMIVVSPFARRDVVDHTYSDHVSVLKFIEANWRLSPLSAESTDNLPNATPGAYVPKVRPAIGDLMTMLDFSHPDFATLKRWFRQFIEVRDSEGAERCIISAIRSGAGLANAWFRTDGAKAIVAGLAAHAVLPLERSPSAAIALMLGIAGHAVGWPFPKGGAQKIADALASYFRSLGGAIQTNRRECHNVVGVFERGVCTIIMSKRFTVFIQPVIDVA